jgi:hypothetical protein
VGGVRRGAPQLDVGQGAGQGADRDVEFLSRQARRHQKWMPPPNDVGAVAATGIEAIGVGEQWGAVVAEQHGHLVADAGGGPASLVVEHPALEGWAASHRIISSMATRAGLARRDPRTRRWRKPHAVAEGVDGASWPAGITMTVEMISGSLASRPRPAASADTSSRQIIGARRDQLRCD